MQFRQAYAFARWLRLRSAVGPSFVTRMAPKKLKKPSMPII